MKCREEYAHCILDCGSALNIKNISEQKNILSETLNKKKLTIIYAKNITEIDTASIQLLLSFTIALTESNINWSVENPSITFSEAVRLLGLDTLLKIK